jgi:hypothetical protein
MNSKSDLLRPFAGLLAGRSVLTLGSGDEAVIRFLSDIGTDVVAAETVADPRLGSGKKFDFIIWLAASNDSARDAGNVIIDLLPDLYSLVDDTGCLLITMGNLLGLSCWNRTSDSMDKGPRWGKRELAGALSTAGFQNVEYYFPYPDSCQPNVLLSERAFHTPGFDVVNLIGPNLTSCCQTAGLPEPGLIRSLVTNGLMADHSNSFFVVASKGNTRLLPGEILGFSFNSGRTAPYRKMNIFYETVDKAIMVRREPYDRIAAPRQDQAITQELAEEQYLPGQLYSVFLEDILWTPDWSVDRLRSWARPYLALLKTYAAPHGSLDGRYVDLTPFNLLLHQDSLAAVDLEWKIEKPVPMAYVFFRGLYHSLARIFAVRKPASGTPVNLYGLCLAIAEGLLDDTNGVLELFLELEPYYFGAVFPAGAAIPPDIDLRVVAPGKAEAALPSPSFTRLYPLMNCNLQVFVETADSGFAEQTSTTQCIGLTRERRVYTIPLPHFVGDVTRLRIDPSDHVGLLCIHAIDIRTAAGAELYHWTPFSRSEVECNGVVILSAMSGVSEPVSVLLDYDPMLIFSLPAGLAERMQGRAVLEIEVSALPEAMAETVLKTLSELCVLVHGH